MCGEGVNRSNIITIIINSNDETIICDIGFYHITDADGRLRRVDYTAGPEGFKAKIQSNEEGLLARDSADAIFDVQAPTAQQQAAVAAQAAAAAAARQRNLGGAAGSTTGRFALAGNRF